MKWHGKRDLLMSWTLIVSCLKMSLWKTLRSLGLMSNYPIYNASIHFLGKKYCYGSTQGEFCHCDYCKCKHGYGSKGRANTICGTPDQPLLTNLYNFSPKYRIRTLSQINGKILAKNSKNKTTTTSTTPVPQRQGCHPLLFTLLLYSPFVLILFSSSSSPFSPSLSWNLHLCLLLFTSGGAYFFFFLFLKVKIQKKCVRA